MPSWVTVFVLQAFLIFHFSGGKMPLLGWPGWCILCKYLIAVLGDPSSPPGKLQESTSVPNLPELWLWTMPPLWLNPDHKVEDGSCVLFWDFAPPCPVACLCGTVRDKGIVHYHMACSTLPGDSPGCTSVLWTVTPCWRMSYGVQRCFPFPHCPHAKINIWYESQGTEASWILQKVLSPFCCCCCYFFNIIFLMGWVTIYCRIKG